ncbi:ribonuclease HI family protein [Candidatus Nitrosocosmicus franklandus]|uniref:ribonuclease HI family protein n=1 Tax=Candidatus Nitrosocosmicus franklandianus TaxID=1798806 RepID=UPI001558B835|nr:ribonuclease HI family protein [Candidatus Nitrosocosmicus franklandus]
MHIDGASRGNPGLSAIGIIIMKDDKVIKEHGEFIGVKTNNQAEYEALRRALEICSDLDREVNILSDSELLINQRNLKYRIRSQELKILSRQIAALEKNYDKITYKHVPRSKNRRADYLANKALDEYQRSNQFEYIDPN